LIREVQVNGRPCVVDGRHRRRDDIEARYRRALTRLLKGI
jgi:hypothetical protein